MAFLAPVTNANMHSLWLWRQSPARSYHRPVSWRNLLGARAAHCWPHSSAPVFWLQSVLPEMHWAFVPRVLKASFSDSPNTSQTLSPHSASWFCHPSLLSRFVGPHPEALSSFLPDTSTFIFLGRISFDNLLPIFLSDLGLAVLFLCPLWGL